jgi:hypothetical protein
VTELAHLVEEVGGPQGDPVEVRGTVDRANREVSLATRDEIVDYVNGNDPSDIESFYTSMRELGRRGSRDRQRPAQH